MVDTNDLLSDDDFPTSFEGEIVDPGKYVMKVIDAKPRIKVSQTGNRYLNVRVGTKSTEDGESVFSKAIYHSIPIEGTNKAGQPNRRMFAAFATALGFEKEAVRSIYSALLEDAPLPEEIGDKTEVSLSLNGDPLNLEGREFMAKLKVREYTNRDGEQVEANQVSSLWAIKE